MRKKNYDLLQFLVLPNVKLIQAHKTVNLNLANSNYSGDLILQVLKKSELPAVKQENLRTPQKKQLRGRVTGISH